MSPDDYERFRRQLESQLRDDVELIYKAYQAKLRAYETVWRTRAELAGVSWEEGQPALSLPAGLPPLLAAAETASSPTGPAPQKAEPAPPAVPPPVRKKAAPAFALYNEILDALGDGRVGEDFDRRELCLALGYTPPRATFHRTLLELVLAKEIVAVKHGMGRHQTRYRRSRPRGEAQDAS